MTQGFEVRKWCSVCLRMTWWNFYRCKEHQPAPAAPAAPAVTQEEDDVMMAWEMAGIPTEEIPNYTLVAGEWCGCRYGDHDLSKRIHASSSACGVVQPGDEVKADGVFRAYRKAFGTHLDYVLSCNACAVALGLE